MKCPQPPATLDDVAEVVEAIAPLCLPAEVRRLWELVDVYTLAMQPHPALCPPSFGLIDWRRARDESDMSTPLALFLVGYTSWNCMSVELDGPEYEGGALFEWRLDDDGLWRRFNSLSEWLDRITGLIQGGLFEKDADYRGDDYLRLRDPATEHALVTPRPTKPHAVYGDRTDFSRNFFEWPAFWQRASGIDPSDAKPRGATQTIADLLAIDEAEEARGTIVAEVASLMSDGVTTNVRVTDGTDEIDVTCDASPTTFGPGLGRSYEFDLVVPAHKRGPLPDPDEAEHSTSEPVEQLARVFKARHGQHTGATASAVRPLGLTS